MSVCIAVPLEVGTTPEALQKLAFLVNKCTEHKPWYADADWQQGDAHRRAMVLRRLSDLDSASWEVYRDSALVGLLHADEIVPKQDARCHFLFFDHELRDKRALCRATMAHLFERFELEALRIEIPTYAAKLAGFARKALSFKYEAEGRAFSWPTSAAPLDADAAKLGSRKHRAILHQGQWHDVLLLSITRAEFFDRAIHETSASDRARAPGAKP